MAQRMIQFAICNLQVAVLRLCSEPKRVNNQEGQVLPIVAVALAILLPLLLLLLYGAALLRQITSHIEQSVQFSAHVASQPDSAGVGYYTIPAKREGPTLCDEEALTTTEIFACRELEDSLRQVAGFLDAPVVTIIAQTTVEVVNPDYDAATGAISCAYFSFDPTTAYCTPAVAVRAAVPVQVVGTNRRLVIERRGIATSGPRFGAVPTPLPPSEPFEMPPIIITPTQGGG
jgi:hypothetical protein